MNTNHVLTETGNIRAPVIPTLVGFVPGFVWRALQSVPARGIVLSFYRAGIMNALDGSQDYLTYWENVHDIGDGRNTDGQDLAYVRQT